MQQQFFEEKLGFDAWVLDLFMKIYVTKNYTTCSLILVSWYEFPNVYWLLSSSQERIVISQEKNGLGDYIGQVSTSNK